MSIQYDDIVFRALMEGSPVPSGVNDEAGKVTYLNAAFIKTFGYTQVDIPTLDTWWLLAYPDANYRADTQEEWFARLQNANLSKEPFVPLEVDIRIKNGETRTVIASASLIPDVANPLFLVTLIDITDRKYAERALKQSEENLSLALSAAEMSMWDINLKTGAIKLCERWYRMLGYDNRAFEVSAETWKKLVHPEDLLSIDLSLSAHIRGESQHFHSEFRLRHKDGHWIWVQSRGKTVERDSKGDSLRIVGANFDISDRKRLVVEGAEMLQKIEAMILNLGTNQHKEVITQNEKPHNLLTGRQQKVLELIALGFTSSAIASQLNISHATAVTHRRNLMKILNLHSAAEITRFAIQSKLISS